MRDQFVETLHAMASANPALMLLTGDLGFGVFDKFAKDFPRQYLNVGVAEQNMTGVATGLALSGKVVFTYSIANFPTLRCLEQIRNDACYHRANVKVVAIGGGFSYGALGVSHHATEDLAILRSLPNIAVLSPGDGVEAAGATEAMVTHPGTCYMRLDRAVSRHPALVDEEFRFGRARVLRKGSDITLISTGSILDEALDAADHLLTEGIHARVLSIHTIKPFDKEAVLAACRETGGIVTVEEHTVTGGLGSLVAETCLDAGVSPRAFHRVGLRAGFAGVVGSQPFLRRYYAMDSAAISLAAHNLLSKHPRRNGVPTTDQLERALATNIAQNESTVVDH